MVIPADFRAIVRRAREGDREAQGILIEEYSEHLKNFVRRRARSSGMRVQYDTDDCVESVWETLLVNRQQLDGIETPDHFMRLLARCVTGKICDAERRAMAVNCDYRREVRIPDSAVVPQAATPGPVDQAIIREEIEALTRELTTVSRHVMALTLEGHNAEEIARRMPGQDPRGIRRIRDRLIKWWREKWRR